MSGHGYLSRRNLVGAALGAGVAVTAGGLLLPRTSDRSTPKARPSGERIRAAAVSLSTADTLDPAKGAVTSDYVRHCMIYNCLTDIQPNLSAAPSLAEAWDTADQRRWHFQLRKGVRFHDGSPLTSADVVYSLLRHKDPATASKMETIAKQFVEVKADGPLGVSILLAGPNVDLPVILSQSHFAIVPNGETLFHRGIGTGPYKLIDFQPSVRTLVGRNTEYWKPGRPYLNEIELIGIPDEVSRVNALLAGDVHMALAVSPHSTQRLNQSPGYIARETKSGLYSNLVMRQDRMPSNNPDLVKAVKYLMDRPLIKRAVFRDYGMIGNDQPIPAFHPYYRADLPQTVLDLDKARWHVQRSGLAGVRLPIYASPAAEGSVDMASVLQEYGARVGLDLAVNRVPADGFWSMHWMKHPFFFANTNPRPTADLLFSLFYKSDAPWNETGWNKPQFDKMLLEARGSSDEALRKELYGDMQEMIRNEDGTSIPIFISFIDGWDKRIKGWHPVPTGGFMGYNFAEHVWWED